MALDFVFSWAQDKTGRMVYIDDVPNGLACNCICPNCKEQLLARHGMERAHHFAHHSETRKATLEICYMVIMYKLAEQIVSERKRIHVPSYYGIFKETDLEFVDVKIDGRYERKDKQPDIIATTKEGKQYLIELIFKYKVQHNKAIDYNNLSCLEIDLSDQKLETLSDFLLNSKENRKWVNNENYFGEIEERYTRAGKNIRVVDYNECKKCPVFKNCCGVRAKNSETPILIENSGRQFRICKPDVLVQRKEEHQRLLEAAERRLERERYDELEAFRDPSERTCFDCKSNLTWMNKKGLQTVAHTKAWGYQRTLHRIWQEPAEVSREKYNRHPAYATCKIEFISKFDNDREAEEFAVLKCLEENRKVCLCIVCSNFDEYNGECQKNCKIGDIPCKDFIMYRFIRTYISSKYKDAKVKVTSLTSAKDEGTLELI